MCVHARAHARAWPAYKALTRLGGTLELERIRLACQTEIDGLYARTNTLGFANFSDLNFRHGTPCTPRT